MKINKLFNYIIIITVTISFFTLFFLNIPQNYFYISNLRIEENNEDNTENINENELININLSTQNELEKIPGIGKTLSKKIIEYRNIKKFDNVEDIKNVPGIKEKLFEKIKKYITV